MKKNSVGASTMSGDLKAQNIHDILGKNNAYLEMVTKAQLWNRSPLPWKLEGNSPYTIKDSRGVLIVKHCSISKSESDSIAEFIVKAVNSHQILVNALEAVYDALFEGEPRNFSERLALQQIVGRALETTGQVRSVENPRHTVSKQQLKTVN